MTNTDKLIRLRIQNVRVFEDVTLDLDGLTVLIGENGAGKSTIMEVLDVLARIPTDTPLIGGTIQSHAGAVFSLLRFGASEFTISATFRGPDPVEEVTLSFTVAQSGDYFTLSQESVVVYDGMSQTETFVLKRDGGSGWVIDAVQQTPINFANIPSDHLLITHSHGRVIQTYATWLLNCMANMKIHAPFNVRAPWVAGKLEDITSMRRVSFIEPARSLTRLGSNVVGAYATILSTMSVDERNDMFNRMRPVMGDHFREIVTRPVDRGMVRLIVRYAGKDREVPVSSLSDGQLSYIGHCAVTKMERNATFVAFDEIDCHAHPKLLVQIIDDYAELAESTNVLLSTHSDVALNAVDLNYCRIVVLEKDANGRSEAHTLNDVESVQSFLEQYGGIGNLRQSGMLPYTFHPKG